MPLYNRVLAFEGLKLLIPMREEKSDRALSDRYIPTERPRGKGFSRGTKLYYRLVILTSNWGYRFQTKDTTFHLVGHVARLLESPIRGFLSLLMSNHSPSFESNTPIFFNLSLNGLINSRGPSSHVFIGPASRRHLRELG